MNWDGSKIVGIVLVLFLSAAGAAQGAEHFFRTSRPSRASGASARTCAGIKIVDWGGNDLSVTSPDGKYTACVKDDRGHEDYTSVYLSHSGHWRLLKRYYDLGLGGSLLWAKDSRAFAWSFTYGGASSGWTAAVFDFKVGHLREIDRIAARDFHRRIRTTCRGEDTDDNSYVVKWIGNRSIVLRFEAHGSFENCRADIPYEFYQVAVPSGRILKHFTGTERELLEKEFNLL